MRQLFSLLILAYIFLTGASAVAEAKTHEIIIESMKFNPSEFHVQKNDTVLWKNKDIVPHTVTAPNLFDSNAIESEKSFRYRVKKSGEISYTCRFHPTMKAKIIVDQ
jgi:plastocyanin